MYKFIAPDPVATALISKLLDGDLRDLMAKMMSYSYNLKKCDSGSFKEINL